MPAAAKSPSVLLKGLLFLLLTRPGLAWLLLEMGHLRVKGEGRYHYYQAGGWGVEEKQEPPLVHGV